MRAEKHLNPIRDIQADETDETWLAALRSDMLRFAILQIRDQATAEDAVQEALTSVFLAHKQFNGRAKYRTWVFAILRHKIIDILRDRIRHPVQGYDDYDGRETELGELFDEHGFWRKDTAPVDWGNPEAELENDYFWRVFEACLTELSEKTARVFMMRELLGFNTEEISTQLSISESNIWVILHRARMRLRSCLEQNWFGE